jgi:hypothetical protein
LVCTFISLYFGHEPKVKVVIILNLTSLFNQTNVRIVVVPIENNLGFVANIKSSFESNIPKWKS